MCLFHKLDAWSISWPKKSSPLTWGSLGAFQPLIKIFPDRSSAVVRQPVIMAPKTGPNICFSELPPPLRHVRLNAEHIFLRRLIAFCVCLAVQIFPLQPVFPAPWEAAGWCFQAGQCQLGRRGSRKPPQHWPGALCSLPRACGTSPMGTFAVLVRLSRSQG